MVPALLGLKGNLEMTLASRLSTQVNIGGFEDSKRKWRIIGCNVALNQVLASGVGFLASLFAVIMVSADLFSTPLVSGSFLVVFDPFPRGTLVRHQSWRKCGAKEYSPPRGNGLGESLQFVPHVKIHRVNSDYLCLPPPPGGLKFTPNFVVDIGLYHERHTR